MVIKLNLRNLVLLMCFCVGLETHNVPLLHVVQNVGKLNFLHSTHQTSIVVKSSN